MQSCNHWINHCFHRSVTCGFKLYIHHYSIGSHFPVLLEYPGTQCSSEFSIKICVRLREGAGQVLGPPRPIQRPECIVLSTLLAKIALYAEQPLCCYHISIRFLSGMSPKRMSMTFNKHAAYLPPFRFPSIK